MTDHDKKLKGLDGNIHSNESAQESLAEKTIQHLRANVDHLLNTPPANELVDRENPNYNFETCINMIFHTLEQLDAQFEVTFHDWIRLLNAIEYIEGRMSWGGGHRIADSAKVVESIKLNRFLLESCNRLSKNISTLSFAGSLHDLPGRLQLLIESLRANQPADEFGAEMDSNGVFYDSLEAELMDVMSELSNLHQVKRGVIALVRFLNENKVIDIKDALKLGALFDGLESYLKNKGQDSSAIEAILKIAKAYQFKYASNKKYQSFVGNYVSSCIQLIRSGFSSTESTSSPQS